MGSWQDCTLGDVLELQRGFDLPIQNRKHGSFPIIASTGINGFHDEYKVKAPGVVIGRSGSIGGGQYIKNDFWPLNTTLWVKDFKGNNPRYCYYLLKNIDFKQFNVGSGVPTLNRNHIHPLQIKVPVSIEIQKQIADILGSIDDKIEINNQINETLEAMANSIFKEWFIDFGPVKAKAEGKKPFGMNDETAALFPDSFEESELGLIPKGWGFCTYSQVMEQHKRSIAPDKYGHETCLHYSLPNYDSGRWPIEEKISEIKSNKFFVPSSSILFSKLNPRTPRVWLPIHKSDKNDIALGSTEFVVIQPKAINNLYYSYCLLREDGFLDRMSQTATGTSNSHQRIKPEAIFEQKIALASQEILDQFNLIVEPLFNLILSNQIESQSLIKTRDLLLPRLISGELNISEQSYEF